MNMKNALAQAVQNRQPISEPPPKKGSSTRIKAVSQRAADIEAIMSADMDVQNGQKALEILQERLSGRIINWLERHGEPLTKHDRNADENYTVPHYPKPLADSEGGVFQLFVRRSKSRDGNVRLTGVIRRFRVGEDD